MLELEAAECKQSKQDADQWLQRAISLMELYAKSQHYAFIANLDEKQRGASDELVSLAVCCLVGELLCLNCLICLAKAVWDNSDARLSRGLG